MDSISSIEQQILELNEKLQKLKGNEGNVTEVDAKIDSTSSKNKNENEVLGENENKNVKVLPDIIQVETVGIQSNDPRLNIGKIEVRENYAEHLRSETRVQRDLEERVKSLAESVSSSRIKRETSTSFNSKQLCRTLSTVPRFFSCVSIPGKHHVESGFAPIYTGTEPSYLMKSFKTFEYGVAEVRVKFDSDGLTKKITFDPFQVSDISRIASKRTIGSFATHESRLVYTLEVVRTIFDMIGAVQVVLVLPSDLVKLNGLDKRNDTDYVRQYEMLSNKFLDQDVPLLPAGGFQHQARYVTDDIAEMFRPHKNRMFIGEIETSSVYNLKVSSTYACTTDQYFSSMYELFLNDLKGRKSPIESYCQQYNILTFRSSNIDIDNIQEFNLKIVPTLTRRECDGTMIMFILDKVRQKQYLLNLRDLLRETNLLGYYTNDELLKQSHIFSCNDGSIKKILNSVMALCDVSDIYECLAAELSTTWMDSNLVSQIRFRNQDAIECLFSVLCVILWFNIFPAVAVDNAPYLMFTLFESLKTLAKKETIDYLHREGFSIVGSLDHHEGLRHASPTIYTKENYFSGRVVYPFLVGRPQRDGIIRRIHDAILLTHIERKETRDSGFIQIPRMREVRQYTIPWNWMAMRVHTAIDDNQGSEGSIRVASILGILISLGETYKAQYATYTSKASFGTSQTRPVDFFSFLNQIPESAINDMALRWHCEMNKLRELGENSIYVPDDTYDGSLIVRSKRPRLASSRGDKPFNVFASNRYAHELKFEIPLFFFFAIRGCRNEDDRVVPDASRQFENLQVIMNEGRTFGDILGFVNRMKYGGGDALTRELYDITQ